MLRKQANDLRNEEYLERSCYEIAREVYQTIEESTLYKFTFSLTDSLWNDLNTVVYDLDHLPEPLFKELIGVIDGLREARDELRLARFLFDVEEINTVHRLVLRNKAVLRGRNILNKVLLTWPLQAPFL